MNSSAELIVKVFLIEVKGTAHIEEGLRSIGFVPDFFDASISNMLSRGTSTVLSYCGIICRLTSIDTNPNAILRILLLYAHLRVFGMIAGHKAVFILLLVHAVLRLLHAILRYR